MKSLKKFGQFFDVFTPEEITALDSALSKLPRALNETGTKQAYTNGFRHSDLIYPFVKSRVIDRVSKHLEMPLNLTVGMKLEEFEPWTIHTDYTKSDQCPGLAVLIPLNTKPLNTATVIFNEECTDNFSQYISTHSKQHNHAAHLHDTVMSHETRDHLEYVSLAMTAPWIPGSVIFWDRRLLHSSDNFLAQQVTVKTALVMFFNNDNHA